MHLAFDLDGTLVDSYNAVLASYKAAGVVPPAGFWGKPWREWLDDETAHERKNVAFVSQGIHQTRALPLIRLFQNNDSLVLTGASPMAAKFMLSYYGLRPAELFCSLNQVGKIDVLKTFTPGIYFDDDEETCLRVQDETSWTVCWVSGPQSKIDDANAKRYAGVSSSRR